MTRQLCLLLAFAALVSAQDPQFRTEVNLITATVLVHSQSGELITDLTKDDFAVFEDGAPQQVQFFAREKELPLSLALVVDVSGSQSRFIKQHSKDVEKFLSTVLEPADRASAICFGNHLRLGRHDSFHG